MFKELVRNRLSLGDFSRHVQRLREVYQLEDAILALNDLQSEGILPTEDVQTKKGMTARASTDSAVYAPIRHGLNILLWEQAIRKGDLTKHEKQRVRKMYAAHAHYSLFRPSGKPDADIGRMKTLERQFHEKALDLAEMSRFEHIRDTADKVAQRVLAALKERRDTPHRQVMNSALISFNNVLSHLKDSYDYKDDLRKVLNDSAKGL